METMEKINEIIKSLLSKCNAKWLELYNLFSGENYNLSDIVFINRFNAKNIHVQNKMDVLRESHFVLMQSGIIFDDETLEMRLERKKELEEFLDMLENL